MKHRLKDWSPVAATVAATVAVLAVVVLAFPALAQDPSDVGRALLQEHCSSCHAIGKTGDSPHVAAPPLRKLSNSYDLDEFPRQLQDGVVAGHPDMPEVKFKEEDARAIGVYLRSIQE